MAKKITFGNDLIKELKKYGLNKIGEVPTKYKNGITTIYYMYSIVSDIDKLTYDTPYIEFTIDEETDGFIMGVMYLEGGNGIGTQFDTYEDVKYFINNAEYKNADLMESKKLIKEEIAEYSVSDESHQGFKIIKIEDGKKFYLSKLAKDIEDSTWSSDSTYAKYFKNKSKAEEIVDEFNSLNESLTERSEENEIIVSELQDTVEYFCGLFEEKGELKGRALESLKNAVERLEVFNSIGSIYQWGVEVLNKNGVKYNGLKESKKSIKESNEKERIEKIYNDLLEGEDSPYINGTLLLSDFEKNDNFFIPYSSWKTFPKKNPSNNNRIWNCKAKFLDKNVEWRDCTISCTLPWEKNLDVMGKTWKDITSYMLLVESVFLDFLR